ncbi:hypothetical protein AC578_3413 [Pseudocercospora eumusae]|uniref:Uncharacterized protein n=1 Tax=Pseudocercospora eumusae TaxID=321146 RepID=A0A139GUJ9_9PEZI|nr:hypothetical protein AC578_3413 [Pseudocercospora eumusae]
MAADRPCLPEILPEFSLHSSLVPIRGGGSDFTFRDASCNEPSVTAIDDQIEFLTTILNIQLRYSATVVVQTCHTVYLPRSGIDFQPLRRKYSPS